MGGQLMDRLPEELNRAGGGVEHASDRIDDRRLPRAIRADHGHHLFWRDIQGGSPKDLNIPIVG